MYAAPESGAQQHGEAMAVTLCFSSSRWRARTLRILAPLFVALYELWLRLSRSRETQGAHALRTIYFFQFLQVMRWPYVGAPQKREYLDRTYHLFIGNFNGGVDKYIDDFADGVAWQLSVFLSGCAGYQPPQPVTKFREFLRSQVISPQETILPARDRQHYYAAYAEAAARDIACALKANEGFERLVRARPETDEAFEARFQEVAQSMSEKLSMLPEAGSPGPGSRIGYRRNKAREVTLLCPYDPANAGPMMEAITAINRAPQSPFAGLPEVHFARMLMIDNTDFPCPAGVPRERIGLSNGYLLVNAVFDGSRRGFVERLWTEAQRPAGIGSALSFCYGYGEAVASRQAFRRYARRCAVRATWHFRDSPRTSVADVVTALARQRAMVQLLAEASKTRRTQFRGHAERIAAIVRPAGARGAP